VSWQLSSRKWRGTVRKSSGLLLEFVTFCSDPRLVKPGRTIIWIRSPGSLERC
jgi:hypothetical protein